MADRNIANNLPRFDLINKCHRVLLSQHFRMLFTKCIRLQVTLDKDNLSQRYRYGELILSNDSEFYRKSNFCLLVDYKQWQTVRI